ncbi:hypothetical protein [Methylobacterium brachythecii]|uniref:Uncharacterized protein n=1 Tax=Methylobacterium brachythecii TaxID=1176177 RepID=A0A7W6AKG0_9HYPH|nr:hypothetical protein [Methylobacterium brachythecii]MBB3905108.1 hypothetical protein [Methylobacterium brachythecii]GLS44383.1 hypothetical protein GCM10007884_23710 [Methylobacterium brachythecii]
MKRNFVVTVKERDPGQPCFLVFEVSEDIGLGEKTIMLQMPEQTDFDDARTIALAINHGVEKVALIDA